MAENKTEPYEKPEVIRYGNLKSITLISGKLPPEEPYTGNRRP